MIKASELRIGNWLNLLIKDKDFGPVTTRMPIKVRDGAHIDSLAAMEDQEDFIEPIPITPELLEKCGFESGRDYWQHSIESVCLNMNYNLCTAMGEYIVSYAETKHFHQLQNLYFYLTGEELSVNL